MAGKLITFEGCDGVGKSVQIRLLREYLLKKGMEVITTREPGGSQIAEKIRSIVLAGENTEMCDICEAMLYAAARAQHVHEVIAPGLKAGKIVICDRYIDSTFAYQGVARGLGTDFADQLNELATSGIKPDLTVFLDLTPKRAFLRKGGADRRDRLEHMDLSFYDKVYDAYKQLERRYPERFQSVDASGEKFATHSKVIEAVDRFLAKNK